jgi:hypothetical protein
MSEARLRSSVEGEIVGVRRLSPKNLSGWERLSNLLQGGGIVATPSFV